MKALVAVGLCLFTIMLVLTYEKDAPVSRVPASIEPVFDFSTLEGKALNNKARERLLGSLEVNKSSDKNTIVIEVGNFVLRNEQGDKDFACGYYDQVSLTFEAEGMAIDGERPKLTVQRSCEVGVNINQMVPIRIPLDKLLVEKPGETEFKFYDEGLPISIGLKHSPGTWPRNWTLVGLKLSHSKERSRQMTFDFNEGNSRNTVAMEW